MLLIKHPKLFKGGVALFSTLVLAGCSKEESRYIEVNEAPPPMAPANPVSTSPVAAERGKSDVGFRYSVPEGWTELAPSSMKLISLSCGTGPEQAAECSVSAFPGDVGGRLANINRWRRQVGLGPLSSEALDGFVQAVTVAGLEGWQVDFTGPGGSTRVVVAVVFQEGKSWFFKLMGPESAVAEELGAFSVFLNSIEF